MLINAETSLYAVFGNPVRHSKSPLIHNACFKHYGHNAVYLAFEVEDIGQCVSAIRHLPIKGASITLPFKSSVLEWLDAVDPDAEKIGAVNTIVYENGRLTGYNTDCLAAVLPLKTTGIAGKNVCIIGAGGAARAVAHGIKQENGNIIICNRSRAKGEKLADKVNGRFIDTDDSEGLRALQMDILINTTPVGMFPKNDVLPVNAALLHPEMIVMDIVYNPVQTRLLQAAQKAGCRTIDGLAMFIHQGAAQYELWTDISPDLDLMRTALDSGEK